MGETYVIQGEVDGVIYNSWGMKEPNYVVRVTATGVRLLAYDTCTETVIRWKVNGEDVVTKFKDKLTFHWHFSYRHVVNDHNNPIHAM